MSRKKLIDPITIEVIRNSLESTVEEMGLTVIRLAHSILFSECKDFSIGILSADGELIALAKYVPSHQGGMKKILDSILKIVGKDNLFPGDVIMNNDPYLGGVHSQDLTLVAPIFHKDKILAYSACVAHRTDTGGMMPGGFCPNASEIYQEAIRFPCIKLIEKGEMREDILRMYLTNVRLPDDQLADTEAQLAALRGCNRAVSRLIDKYGANTFLASVKEILNLSERRARAEIAKIPDGVYTYTDYTEHDGFTDRDWKIQVTVEIKGSDIYVDYTGTDEQAKGSINSPPHLSESNTWVALMFWLDPTIPRNQGLYRPLKKINVPKGTILNPNHPAPVSGCTIDTAGIILDVMLGAMAKATPEKGCGCWTNAGTGCIFYGINPETGEQFIHQNLDSISTGGGARSFVDGWLVSHFQSCGMQSPSIEVVEQQYPLRYLKRELATDNGGDGKFRGGPGYDIEYEVLTPMQLTVFGLRQRHPPLGTAGGTSGGPYVVSIISEGKERKLPQKVAGESLKKGDIVRLRCAGGGGYGNPKDRATEMVRNDVLDGLISLDKAKRVYGFEE